MRTVKRRWVSLNARRTGHGYGIVIDSLYDPLTNLRFADDILLVAQSRADASKMLGDLANEALTYGLEINFAKTKVLTTQQTGGAMKSFELQGKSVEVLGLLSYEKYLGRRLCIGAPTTSELEHRLAAAWGAFMQFKSELCNRKYPLSQRIKLFDMVVTPRALFAAATWTTTKALDDKLGVTQRKMLRFMTCTSKEIGQDWGDYMQQSTRKLRNIMQQHHLQDWVYVQRLRKWRFARATAAREDERWSTRILKWKPSLRGYRSVGRPTTRWSDDLDEIL